MNAAIKKYRNILIQKRYSDNTIKTYCNYFKDFCVYFKNESLENITTSQINSYILDLIKSKNISISQRNQRINAIKFYFEKVLGRRRMKAGKIIYLIGRDNWQKDGALNKILINYLKKTQHKIVWEDPAGDLIYKLRNIETRFDHLPNYIKKVNLRILQIFYGLFHWSYFAYLSDRKSLEVQVRTKRLTESLLKLEKGREVIILSRSAGGRYSSLIADKLNIKHLICISYPFKHPDKEDEPERYLHLEKIQTPMLIIQGDKDEYGGLDVKDKYSLSPNIELVFVKAQHNFNIDEQDWEKVFTKISEVINS